MVSWLGKRARCSLKITAGPADFSGENLMKLSTPVSGSGCWWVAVGRCLRTDWLYPPSSYQRLSPSKGSMLP